MIVFAAQMSMGASWRVGVAPGEVGALVTGGLYRISRNQVFPDQAMLPAGGALAIPSLPTLLAVAPAASCPQARIHDQEQAADGDTDGAEYEQWAAWVPRWIASRGC